MVVLVPILASLAFYAAFPVATLLDSTSLSALRRGPHMAQMGFHHCFKNIFKMYICNLSFFVDFFLIILNCGRF